MLRKPIIMGVLLNIALSAVQDVFVSQSTENAVISDFVATSPTWILAIFWALIIVVIPACEELIFRGLLWKISSFVFSSLVTGILVAVVFSVLHAPESALFLLPFALYLSWLRTKENSIVPGVWAHIAFNLTGVLTPFVLSNLPL
jgi:membrane protease YdiL (CAAX protease family)